MNIRKPEVKSAINQFRKFLANAGVEVPLNLMQEGFARSQGFEDWQALCAYDASVRCAQALVEPEIVPDTAPGSRFRFAGDIGDAVWVRMPSASADGADISVYLKRGGEGVTVDLHSSAAEDRDCVVSTYLSYSEAVVVEELYTFDENGRKPMLWGDLPTSDALRFGDGPWQPMVYEDGDVLCAIDAKDHRHAEARKVFPRGHYFSDSLSDSVAIVCLDLDHAAEENILAGELQGAQVDREGIVHLKDGRRMEFKPWKKK
jgi:hypothetical protein